MFYNNNEKMGNILIEYNDSLCFKLTTNIMDIELNYLQLHLYTNHNFFWEFVLMS